MTKLLITFSTDAFEDYKEWQIQDRKTLKKLTNSSKVLREMEYWKVSENQKN